MADLKRTLLTGCAVAFALTGAANATGLIYTPIIPGLGGNPNYWTALLGSAQIQNQFPAPSSGGGSAPPDITFPPIVIDLGGIGGNTPTTPTTTTTGN